MRWLRRHLDVIWCGLVAGTEWLWAGLLTILIFVVGPLLAIIVGIAAVGGLVFAVVWAARAAWAIGGGM